MKSEQRIRAELEALEGLIDAAPRGKTRDEWEKRADALRWVLDEEDDGGE